MKISRILVPTDFTATADKATRQAIVLARATGAAIDLLHIANDDTSDRLVKAGLPKNGLADAMRAKAEAVQATTGIGCGYIIREGNILTAIPEVAAEGAHQLMVAGTHGVKGIRQNLFGADMLRILKSLAIPAVVVQQGGAVKSSIGRILLPVGSHETYINLVHACATLAKAFRAEVCIYGIERPSQPYSEQILKNVKQANDHFMAEGIPCKTVNEKPTVFSVGFAKQTLQYAADYSFDLMAIMSVSSEEHAFLAEPDKERIINNDLDLPILCGPGIEGWTHLMPSV